MKLRAGRALDAAARRLWWDSAQRNKRALAVGTVCLLGLSAPMVALMAAWRGANMAWFVAGGCVVASMQVVDSWLSGPRVQRLRDGANAERFTAWDVRRARRFGWRLVSDVEFHGYNVDHVIAGPAGVFAIETKWTNVDWRLQGGHFDSQWANSAVAQSQYGAEQVEHLLKQRCSEPIRVEPILVVWGPGQPHLEEPVVIGRVRVVPGQLWKPTLAVMTGPLGDDLRDRALAGVRSFVRDRERRAREGSGWPRLIRGALWTRG